LNYFLVRNEDGDLIVGARIPWPRYDSKRRRMTFPGIPPQEPPSEPGQVLQDDMMSLTDADSLSADSVADSAQSSKLSVKLDPSLSVMRGVIPSNMISEKQSFEYHTFDEFRNALLQYETETNAKFCITKTKGKAFEEMVTIEDIQALKLGKVIRWELKSHRSRVPIFFNQVPFLMLGMKHYDCQHAACRKTQSRRYNEFFAPPVKKRRQYPSKKGHCPCCFTVQKIFYFYSHKIAKDTHHNRWDASKNIMQQLNNELGTNCKFGDLFGSLVYICVFPHPDSHQHDWSIDHPRLKL